MATTGDLSRTVTVSSGTPTPVQTPQSLYQLALAQQIAGTGNNLTNWASNQYQYVKGLANEAIPQYLHSATEANQLAGEQLQQYNNMYLPAQEQFNNLANSYASAPRQAYAMGQAEADAGNAAAQSWNNTKNDLVSHGIDPSSGMYAGLESAANTARGASEAGAANQARQGVENAGIGLQEQNINFGQTMPASALNALNTGYGGQAGAVNAGESAVNTGATAYGTANNFYQTAMGLNNAAVGQGSNSYSTSSANPVGSNVHTGDPYVIGGALTGLTSNPGGTSPAPVPGPSTVGLSRGGLAEPQEGYRRGGRVKRSHGVPGGGADGATGKPRTPPAPLSSYNLANNTPPGGAITYERSSPTPSPGSPGSGGAPHIGSAVGGIPDGSANGPPSLANGPPSLANGPPSLANGPPSLANGPPSLANGNPEPANGLPMAAAHGGLMDPKAAQPLGHQGRPHPPHPYAVNGLPDASTGGHVPYELSPSHGHTTDDVVANLNAGEFVVPRRTVHHYGHKFMYDLIAKGDKEMGLHPQSVGGKPVQSGSGADKARSAATGQNFSAGGGA